VLQRLDQYGTRDAKLFQTLLNRLRQNHLAFFCQPHQNPRAGARAPYKIIGLGTIYEFDCAVVMASKLLRKGANGRFGSLRKTSYGKEQLVLPRFDTSRFSCLIAEIQVSADVISKFG
jgi:hypothetical protein